MTAAYMQILIHAVNGSLFPDADPNAASWTGPPPGIVTVQSLLYTSLATSLFAAFLAMLGKQWINRYLRRHGGSAADKSRDRQRKIDGLEGWRFRLVIESLPVMLQIALLLLGCALSKYLWTINRTVAGFILAFTVFGVASYTFFTLTASLSYECPYQTPLSVIIRGCAEYIGRGHSTFARSLRSLNSFLANMYSHSAGNIKQILRRLRSSARGVLCGFSGHATVPPQGTPHIPLAIVTAPTRIFEDIRIDWDGCKADARCIAWVLYSTTDSDVIYSTVRFAADTIWYPEIARAISPHILANLFFDCLLDGQVIPDKSEHATSIGMALVSVLSIHLSVETEGEGLRELCERITANVRSGSASEPMSESVVAILKFVVQTPSPITGRIPQSLTPGAIPHHSPTTHKLWLSRVILQTVWRWRRVQDPTAVLELYPLPDICQRLMADGDQTLVILETNLVLTMAILMGLVVDIHDLYAPVDQCVIYSCLSLNSLIVIVPRDAWGTVLNLLHRHLQMAIREGAGRATIFLSVLYALSHFDPKQVAVIRELWPSWMTDILGSRYGVLGRSTMAGEVVGLFWEQIPPVILSPAYRVDPIWFPLLFGFLQLGEEIHWNSPAVVHRGVFALQICSRGRGSDDLGPTILPILASALQPTHRLQSRKTALKTFRRFGFGWFSSQMEGVSSVDRAGLLHAVGDPFQSIPDSILQDERRVFEDEFNPMSVAAILMEFASSDLWRDHLRSSNFVSCEELISTAEGRRSAFIYLRDTTEPWPFLRTPAKIVSAIDRLESLLCPNTAEAVLAFLWASRGVDGPLVDLDGWRLIRQKTLAFYQTHGIGRLKVLSQHIMAKTRLEPHHWNRLCRVEGVRLPIRVAEGVRVRADGTGSAWWDFPLIQMCRLKILYQLYGCTNPTMWEEMLASGLERVDSEVANVSVGRSGVPTRFVDWASDYP